MIKKVILCALFFQFVTSTAFASSTNPAGKITTLTVGDTYVRVATDDMTNSEGCSATSYFILEFTNDPDSAMYSAILTAYTANRDIYFILSGCSSNMASIIHVYLE